MHGAALASGAAGVAARQLGQHTVNGDAHDVGEAVAPAKDPFVFLGKIKINESRSRTGRFADAFSKICR